MNGHQKMYTPQEVVTLLALDLPPAPSPELKALFPLRVHKQGVSTESAHIASKPKAQKEVDFPSLVCLDVPHMVEMKRQYSTKMISQRHHGFLSYYRC